MSFLIANFRRNIDLYVIDNNQIAWGYMVK